MNNTNTVDATTTNDTTVSVKRPRGFGAMTPEMRRSISSRGGKAAHQQGTAHRFSKELARTAGQKGGKALHSSRGRRKTPDEATNSSPEPTPAE